MNHDEHDNRSNQAERMPAMLAAFDAIGWTTSFDALTNSGYRETTADIYRAVGMVPEPATWGLMLVGFAMVGGATRYRRRATTLRAA